MFSRKQKPKVKPLPEILQSFNSTIADLSALQASHAEAVSNNDAEKEYLAEEYVRRVEELQRDTDNRKEEAKRARAIADNIGKLIS